MNPKGNPNTLKPWEKGKSGNPKGRPRKWTTELKHIGWKRSEVADAFAVMLAMDLPEIIKIGDDETQPVLLNLIAKAIIRDGKEGVLQNTEMILARAHGKPKETVEATVSHGPDYDAMTPEELDEALVLMRKLEAIQENAKARRETTGQEDTGSAGEE